MYKFTLETLLHSLYSSSQSVSRACLATIAKRETTEEHAAEALTKSNIMYSVGVSNLKLPRIPFRICKHACN